MRCFDCQIVPGVGFDLWVQGLHYALRVGIVRPFGIINPKCALSMPRWVKCPSGNHMLRSGASSLASQLPQGFAALRTPFTTFLESGAVPVGAGLPAIASVVSPLSPAQNLFQQSAQHPLRRLRQILPIGKWLNLLHICALRQLQLHCMDILRRIAVMPGDMPALEAPVQHMAVLPGPGAHCLQAPGQFSIAARAVERPQVEVRQFPVEQMRHMGPDRMRIPQQRITKLRLQPRQFVAQRCRDRAARCFPGIPPARPPTAPCRARTAARRRTASLGTTR
ncbi:hypothetical protein COLO4_01731 [Corchorus olitorius]|uniref:Uncharacterized protein n=1 Tax=Corchorus olitorius TaxID=93759 RepID=A0A1R3L245_9ROSI|nr:hypothetical protein COLO4_01731 [Corchorus olitorius]